MENTENAQQVDNLISINPEIRDYLLEISKMGQIPGYSGIYRNGIVIADWIGNYDWRFRY